MDMYEVTVGRYNNYLQKIGGKTPEYWLQVDLEKHANRPIIGVTWPEAHSYCQWAGKRLPTRNVWALASDPDIWGNSEPTTEKANFGKTVGSVSIIYEDLLEDVGKTELRKSSHGIYDLYGNVSEWVNDSVEGSARVLHMGGSWLSQGDELDHEKEETTSWDSRSDHIGFRCAKDAGTPQ